MYLEWEENCSLISDAAGVQASRSTGYHVGKKVKPFTTMWIVEIACYTHRFILFIYSPYHFYASMIFDNKSMCNERRRWRKCLVYVYEHVSVCHVGIKLSSTSSTEIGEHVREGVLSPRIIRSNTRIVGP